VTPDGSQLLVRAEDPGGVTRALADQGHYVTELTPVVANLESVFLELTGEA
jgi:ABC-2 type transport system ATP-binding protein